jgi:AcrR family transcriptional regulator
MPRVSEAHLAARREQIISAATRCFVRNGFHQSSMQDVIKEAGLSVGAFYRYFKSKDELIRAIAEDKVGIIIASLEQLQTREPAPTLHEIFAEVLAQVDASLTDNGPVRIAVQVWGEAAHDPELAAMVNGIYGRIREAAVTLAARLSPGTDPAAIGPVMLGLIQGYVLQRVLMGKVDREGYLAGIAALTAGYGAA